MPALLKVTSFLHLFVFSLVFILMYHGIVLNSTAIHDLNFFPPHNIVRARMERAFFSVFRFF